MAICCANFGEEGSTKLPAHLPVLQITGDKMLIVTAGLLFRGKVVLSINLELYVTQEEAADILFSVH